MQRIITVSLSDGWRAPGTRHDRVFMLLVGVPSQTGRRTEIEMLLLVVVVVVVVVVEED